MTAVATLQPPVEQRLGAICTQHALSDQTCGALERLLDIVASDPHAPTTVRDPAAAVDVHIADSLSALAIDRVRHARTIADIGAGAGFPGLALAAALPQAEVRLIESVQRKAAFIEGAAREAGLANARAVAVRVEDWELGVAANEVVTARAVGQLAVLCEYAAPLLTRDGVLVAWKGARDAREEARAGAAAAELGLETGPVLAVRPYQATRAHHLHLYLKVGDTPSRFPRRPGIARKRPLGG